MPTLKLVMKHTGASLVSKLIEVNSLDHANAEITLWLDQWRDVKIDHEIPWHFNDEGMLQRDLLWYPPGQEPFLFRFTYSEIGVVPELATAAVATRLDAGSSPVHASMIRGQSRQVAGAGC